MKIVYLGFVFAGLQMLCQWSFGFTLLDFNCVTYPFISNKCKNNSQIPVAVDDTYLLAVGCGNETLEGNLMENDIFDPDSIWLSDIDIPAEGLFLCGPKGNFVYKNKNDFRGEIVLNYRLRSIFDSNVYSDAQLIIYVKDDFDCDGVANDVDIDNDNDGIVDEHEGTETEDTDGDGIPNRFDIDSDNDGITDFEEWQTEGLKSTLILCDNNCDGWDDAFDPQEGGDYYEQVDTDGDGTPDFLDSDSDNDGISDFIEAFDVQNNHEAEFELSNLDFDNDGLDNSCDTINCEASRLNPMGSNSPLPDLDGNNIRDWRDPLAEKIEAEELFARFGDDELVVYPNPVISTCKLRIPENEDLSTTPYSVQVFNINGSLVHLELIYNSETSLDLTNLKKGTYFMHVQIGANTINSKFVKLAPTDQ